MARTENVGNGVPCQPQVDGTVVVCRPSDSCFGFYCVGRGDHGHARHCTHDGQVLNVLMGLPAAAVEEAGIGGGDLDGCSGLGDQHADGVQSAVG
ncbi:hypothetical protein D3C73_1460280 [compost metagenome]